MLPYSNAGKLKFSQSANYRLGKGAMGEIRLHFLSFDACGGGRTSVDAIISPKKIPATRSMRSTSKKNSFGNQQTLYLTFIDELGKGSC